MKLSKHEITRLSKTELSQKDIAYFSDKYGDRFIRALRAVEERKVFRYHFLPSDTLTWTVKGRRREYLVIPEVFCTGRDFYQSVVIAREVDACYHLLAQKIAEIRDEFTAIESTDADRRRFYTKWRSTR